MYTFPNGKKYIGITCRRLSVRAGKYGQRYKGCPRLWVAICKYGWDNIHKEILYSNLTKGEAEDLEIKLISEYNTIDKRHGYNVAKGGATNAGYKHTEEWKRELGKRNSGNGNPFYGKHHTPDVVELLRENAKNISKEDRNKRVSKFCKNVQQIDIDTGEVIATFKSVKEAIDKTGITHISECCLGKQTHSGGFKWEYVGELHECKRKSRTKKVKQIDKYTNEVIKVWNSGVEAAKFYGVNKSTIYGVCNGNRKTSCGYKWEFADQ